MSRDIINIDSIRLTTELNKFRRNKVIPSSFLDGTFTILDLKDNYQDFSASHKKLADKLIDMYNVELRQSAEGLQKSLCNGIGFLEPVYRTKRSFPCHENYEQT